MNGLKIDCFYHSEQSASMKELGLEHTLSDCDVRPIVFYKIGAISSYLDANDGEFGVIHTEGSDFTTTLKFNELEKKIERWHLHTI